MKNRTVTGIICIVAALIFAFGAVPLINAISEGKTTALTAVKDIEKGHVFCEEDFTAKTVHSSDLPENYISDTEDIMGLYASCDIKSGALLQSSMLSKDGANPSAVLSSLNGEKQAISITLDTLASGISGSIKSGDIVSAIVSDGGGAVIPKELKYLKVITATYSDGRDINEERPEDENYTPPATVTLLANSVQSGMLAQYEHNGYIHLSLVYRGSSETADRFIAVQDAEFNGGK